VSTRIRERRWYRRQKGGGCAPRGGSRTAYGSKYGQMNTVSMHAYHP
jgi:hypothetical protein